MGGLFLLIIVAPIIGMVIWIRKAKPGTGKSVAVGCGVAFLVGLVLLLLLVGLSFAWFSFTRGNAMHEADAQQESPPPGAAQGSGNRVQSSVPRE